MTKENNNCTTFLKLVGDKSSTLDIIKEYLPHSFHDYYEPFLSSVPAFFGLQDRINKAYLSDLDKGLINTFNTVKLYPQELVDELERHQILHNKEFYHYVRDEAKSRGMIEKAARFIYLNRAGSRRMLLGDNKCKFNISYGYHPSKNILQRDRIHTYNGNLKKTTITRCPYYKISPKKHDFVFLDPPYHKEEKMLTEYTMDGFTLYDQEQLYRFFQSLNSKGVYAMIIHHDSAYVREKYSKFNIKRIPIKRNIANDTTKDTSVYELIIRNYR